MKTLGAIAAVLLLLTLIMTGGHDAALASSFTPIDYSVALTNSAASANSSFTVTYTLDAGPPAMALEEAHVSFIPSAWGVANDAAIPNGAMVGSLRLNVTESVSNNSCNDSKLLWFDLLDATTNTATNLLADSPRIPSATWPGFTVVGGLPDAVNKYPTFLKNAFPGLTPRSRAYGSVDAAIGGINRVVNVLVFEPGTSLPGMSPINASLGYIVVVVVQDPTAPAASSTVTDQCSSFVYTREDSGTTGDNFATTLVNEGGFVYRTNPAAQGTYTFMEYLRSQRDFDNDGIENRLDACPYVSTPSWNPRNADPIYDVDGDGIPGQDNLAIGGEQLLAGSGCDPTPLTANTDPDGDGFTNRQDNCALVANALQEDPDADGIGNACDNVDTVPDGHLHEICVTANVNVGTPGAPTTLTCPEFIVDMDSDGFTRTVEEHVGTGSEDPCGNDGWPADLSSTGGSADKINLQDITSFTSPDRRFNTNIADLPGNIRWDIAPGPGASTKDINLRDLTRLTTLVPPMLEGARAFNGPLCPWP